MRVAKPWVLTSRPSFAKVASYRRSRGRDLLTCYGRCSSALLPSGAAGALCAVCGLCASAVLGFLMVSKAVANINQSPSSAKSAPES